MYEGGKVVLEWLDLVPCSDGLDVETKKKKKGMKMQYDKMI